jgi:large subunit ribosomal protein L15
VSRNRIEYAIINVGRLEALSDVESIDLEFLEAQGLVKKGRGRLKVLAQGDISKALTVRAHKFSAAAVEKITGAGGTVEIIER